MSGVSLPVIRDRRSLSLIRTTITEYHTAFNRKGQSNHDWCLSVGEVAVGVAEDAERLLAAVDAVLALHQPTAEHEWCGYCGEEAWPCATVRAVAAHVDTKEA